MAEMVTLDQMEDAEKIRYLRDLIHRLDDELPGRLQQHMWDLQKSLVGVREQQAQSKERLAAIRESNVRLSKAVRAELESIEQECRRTEMVLERQVEMLDYVQKITYALSDDTQLALLRRAIREPLKEATRSEVEPEAEAD